MKKENVFKRFYTKLVDLGGVLRKSDTQGKIKILLDLLFLAVVTCLLKIPFILIRDLGDNAIETFISEEHVFGLWGLVIEILYVICAVFFFIKTFIKWFDKLDSNKN